MFNLEVNSPRGQLCKSNLSVMVQCGWQRLSPFSLQESWSLWYMGASRSCSKSRGTPRGNQRLCSPKLLSTWTRVPGKTNLLVRASFSFTAGVIISISGLPEKMHIQDKAQCVALFQACNKCLFFSFRPRFPNYVSRNTATC